MEPVLVVLIVFSSVLVLMKMILDHRRSTLIAAPREQNSLGSSELKRLIQEAVQEAVQPISDRLELLDTKVNTEKPLLLDEPLHDVVNGE